MFVLETDTKVEMRSVRIDISMFAGRQGAGFRPGADWSAQRRAAAVRHPWNQHNSGGSYRCRGCKSGKPVQNSRKTLSKSHLVYPGTFNLSMHPRACNMGNTFPWKHCVEMLHIGYIESIFVELREHNISDSSWPWTWLSNSWSWTLLHLGKTWEESLKGSGATQKLLSHAAASLDHCIIWMVVFPALEDLIIVNLTRLAIAPWGQTDWLKLGRQGPAIYSGYHQQEPSPYGWSLWESFRMWGGPGYCCRAEPVGEGCHSLHVLWWVITWLGWWSIGLGPSKS